MEARKFAEESLSVPFLLFACEIERRFYEEAAAEVSARASNAYRAQERQVNVLFFVQNSIVSMETSVQLQK